MSVAGNSARLLFIRGRAAKINVWGKKTMHWEEKKK